MVEHALAGGVEGAPPAGEHDRAQHLVARAQRDGEQRLRARRALVEHEDGPPLVAAVDVVEEQRGVLLLQQPRRPGLLEQRDLPPLELASLTQPSELSTE